jgi:uncharacterized protein (TIGR02646 family)
MSLNKLKEQVFNRASGLCEYCKSPANISTQSFVIEHIIPKSKAGKTSLENLALSCQGCNNYKYNKISGTDSISNEEINLFHPRMQDWSENFAWSADGLEIIGLNATGRVTVDTLKLNRTELKNLRKLLVEVGKHPPE